MRSISFLILFILSNIFTGYCQEIIQTIKWKEGESKQITIQRNGKEIKNGTTIKDTTLTSKGEIFVRDITDTYYLVKFITENQLVKLGCVYYPRLLNDLSGYHNLEIEIKVNKDSLTTKVMNKREYDTYISKTHDEILEIMKIKAPDKVDMAAVQLDKLLISLKQDIEAVQIMDIILNSYKIRYSFADTLTTTDSNANPFKFQNFNGAKVKTYVESKKNSDTFNIVSIKSYDFDAYKDLMLGLSKQTLGALGNIVDKDASSSFGELNKVFNTLFYSYKFDASESLIITRQVDSNWPKKVLKKIDLKVSSVNQTSTGLVDLLIEII